MCTASSVILSGRRSPRRKPTPLVPAPQRMATPLDTGVFAWKDWLLLGSVECWHLEEAAGLSRPGGDIGAGLTLQGPGSFPKDLGLCPSSGCSGNRGGTPSGEWFLRTEGTYLAFCCWFRILLQSLCHVQVVVAVRGVVRLGGRAVKGPFQSWISRQVGVPGRLAVFVVHMRGCWVLNLGPDSCRVAAMERH